MDAVELPILAVSKLLNGGEGIGSGGSREGEVEPPIAAAAAAAAGFGDSSIARFGGGSGAGKDATHTITAVQQSSFSRNKRSDVGVCMHDSSLPNFEAETMARQITVEDSNNSIFLLPKCTGKQLQRRGIKQSKNSSLYSKRPESEQIEVPVDSNALFGKHAPVLAQCAEKSRVVGQRHNIDGRRGDKRNLKQTSKTKYDSFFSKVGLVNNGAATGGGNILGIYGLKSDIHDVTKNVEELSLNDLLDGSYKYQSCHDKGKKAVGTNENLLHTVKKACSMVQPRRVLLTQNTAELDNNFTTKMDILNSGSSVTSGTDKCDKTADVSSSSKDACTTSNNAPLYEPNDILERLALPPANNLDSLLLDTSNTAVPSRGTIDIRSSKSLVHGASLPPFHWPQGFNGPSKTAIDTGRLSTSRSRWVRIGSIASSLEAPSGFSDIDSITSDHGNMIKGLDAITSLKSVDLDLPQRRQNSFDGQLNFSLAMGNLLRVPETEGKLAHHENNGVLMSSPGHPKFPVKDNDYELDHSKQRNNGYSASSSHHGGRDQHQWNLHASVQVVHSPRVLAAAEILCDIAKRCREQGHNIEKLRWPKKLSQNGTKARKSRSSPLKTEVTFVTPKSVTRRGHEFEIADQIMPSKKLKLTNNKKKDTSHNDNDNEREPMKWSSSTSNRSPPSRTENPETKHSNAETVKLFGMVSSSSKRPLDKACNGEQKLRKALVIDWGRGRSKNACSKRPF